MKSIVRSCQRFRKSSPFFGARHINTLMMLFRPILLNYHRYEPRDERIQTALEIMWMIVDGRVQRPLLSFDATHGAKVLGIIMEAAILNKAPVQGSV